MKYLQTFALFESKSSKINLVDPLNDLLISRVTLPDLCKNDTVVWSCVIDSEDYDDYLEAYENSFDKDDGIEYAPIEEEEYLKWVDAYKPSSDHQRTYDDFMRCTFGYSDWCEEHRDEPVKWYMDQFEVSKGLGVILKVWNTSINLLNASIEIWDAMDEFPEVFQPLLKDRVGELIANWNSQIANEVRTKAPGLWQEVIKAIDPTGADVSADLGELGF
jgi:hypothetical protein